MENLHEILKELHHWNEVNILYIMFSSNSGTVKTNKQIKEDWKEKGKKKKCGGKRKKIVIKKAFCILIWH